jgi:putative transposase
MPRRPRTAPGGLVYHVLNRGNDRQCLFADEGDYRAFEHLLAQTLARGGIELFTYIFMPNHWHLAVRPAGDDDLSTFMHRLCSTHAHRWRLYHRTTGWGHLYQSRFKSFPVQEDGHFLVLCRYIERNAMRAGLTPQAELWPWSGLWQREHGDPARLLAPWPVERPADWARRVNQPETAAELAALRECAARNHPWGAGAWVRETTLRLGLPEAPRPRGRPRKAAEAGAK